MKLSVQLHKEASEIYWCILSYIVLIPLFLLVSTVLTVTNTFSACLSDCRVGRINLGTLCGALSSHYSGLSGSSMPLSCSISDSTSTTQSSSLLIALSRLAVQFSQFSVSEMLAGEVYSSLPTGWRSILLIWQTFNIWVCPPGRSFADKAGGKGDLSDNVNAAAPSCRRSDHDAWMISSISEIYSTAVIWLFWARDSFCVAHKIWPPCNIYKKSWNIASVSNGFGPSLQVQVQVQTVPLPKWRSGLSIHQNRQLGYHSMAISWPISIGLVVCKSPSGSVYKFVLGSCCCHLIVVYYQNCTFDSQYYVFACFAVCDINYYGIRVFPSIYCIFAY